MSGRIHFTILTIFLFLLTLPIIAQAQNLVYKPESVAFDSLRNRYLVSNIGNGAIIAIDTGGVQDTFMTGFGSCFGNCISGDSFYVSNGTNIFGIDLTTEEIFMDIEMPPASRSYDGLTTDTSGNLYVVYTGGAIYKIPIAQQVYSIYVASGLATATQDIIFDARNNRLLLAGYSTGAPIQAIDMTDSSLTNLVYTPFGFMDGITMDHAGNLYLSCSTGGTVYRYNKHITNPPELISSGHHEPSGLDYNFRDNVLAVPNFSGNTVDFIPLSFSPDLDSYEFDDAGGGDGDGLFEAGETVAMTVSVINYRTSPITDLTISLSCDDATIEVIDGSVYLGDLASMDTTTNEGDALQFAIPADYNPRIDSLILEMSYNGGSESDIIVIEQALGRPNVLLVDDDNFDNIEEYYIQCLKGVRIPWDIWSTLPPPTAADLSEYDLVIWFSGDYRLPVDNDDITAMQGYLDGGGNLFLTGQGIAAMLDMTNPVFLNDYLKAEYTGTQLVQALANIPGAQVVANSDTVWIAGSGGANNQTDPDHLAAVNGGIGEMIYIGSSDLGAVSYSGEYKCLFFGFGFEAIINGSSRWTDRYTIFSRILDFFEFQRPGVSPAISGLGVTAENRLHIVDHAFEISWSFSDGGTGTQALYQIQAGTDNEWNNAEMWDSGPVSSSSPQTDYAGSPLEDGDSYYLRARASNGVLWSPWSSLSIRMNSVPVPAGLTPDSFQEAAEGAVSLTHSNLPDNEGDAITYTYEVFDDELMTTLVAGVSGHPAGTEATTSWSPTETLAIDNDYFWRVRAADGFEPGQWSDLATFILVAAYICGDANGDEQANVADAVFLINYVFKGGAAPFPLEAGDANCDSGVNVGDAVYLIAYVFNGGPTPCASCP